MSDATISAEDARPEAPVAEHPAVSRIAPFPRAPGHDVYEPAPALPDRARQKALWIALAVIIAGVIAWIALREPADSSTAAKPAASPLELAAVDVAVVEPRVLSRALPLSGSIAPVVQATLKAKVGGEVEEVTVREGQDVAAGSVIARIDTRNLQAEYDRELAAIEKARADFDLARLNRDKNRSLLEQRYISQNTYEATESAYAASVASLKLAEAQARLAKISLDDAVIRAPFAGTIASRMVEPGEKVSPDSPVVTLVDLREMLLEAAVPAAEIPSVRTGQVARFTVGGFGERRFEGVVQRINPVTADGSRAITLYVAVPNADRALKGGMFAKGELQLESSEPVLAIPQSAVRLESGVPVVYTLANGRIGRKQVTLGDPVESSAYVQVRDGLAAGERVIVAELGDRKPGDSAFVRGQ